jgi:hypothetical protein
MLCKINKIVIGVFFVTSMATMSYSQSIQINSSGLQLNPNAGSLLKLDNNGNPTGDPILYPSQDNKGFIGTSVYCFRHIYVNWLHYSNLDHLSDSTVKENITDLENVFDKIKKIRTVRFDYKTSANESDSSKQDFKNKIGFLAQDVMRYFPEMVKKDNGNGKYSINDIEMIPILLKAVQDLKVIVDKQQQAIKELSGR